MLKQIVVTTDEGVFVREEDFTDLVDLDEMGNRVFMYTSESGLGYRADRILHHLRTFMSEGRGTRSFGSASAAYLLLQVAFRSVVAGEDEKGRFVVVGNKTFYETYLELNTRGEVAGDNARGYLSYSSSVTVEGVDFIFRRPQLCHLLFHAASEYHPLFDANDVYPSKQDDLSSPMSIVSLRKSSKHQALLLTLLEENLLIRGNLSYYTFVPDLLVTLDLAQFLAGTQTEEVR